MNLWEYYKILEKRLDDHIVRIGLLEDKISDLELTVNDLVDETEDHHKPAEGLP